MKKWALTTTFNFDKNEARLFESFDDAKEQACLDAFKTGDSVYLWKLTKGNPIKWLKV